MDGDQVPGHIKSVKRIGISSKWDDNAIELAGEIYRYLCNKGIDVVLEDDIATRIGEKGIRIRRMNVDILICVGGDGTLLRALQKTSSLPEPPAVLGINIGTLGFLTDVPMDRATEVVGGLLKEYEVFERERLSLSIDGYGLPPATNEVVLVTAQPAKMLRYVVYVDGQEMEHLRADGLVIATPTGSTAYSMSAGGPIVDPRVLSMLVVPLAPFKLSARPWVVPMNSKVEVELSVEKEALVVVDGQYTRTLKKGEILSVTRHDKPARFVKVGEVSF
ncbi:MAG: NAD(+)/NADH kinase, partial [Methermicoccaceae archaeon]